MATFIQEPLSQTQNELEDMHFDGRYQQSFPNGGVNVGNQERNVSLAAGTIVALQGLSRGTLPGLLTAAVGGYLIYRGATGRCPLYRTMSLDTYHTQGKPHQDEITEKGVHVEQAMLIQKPAEQLYKFWR